MKKSKRISVILLSYKNIPGIYDTIDSIVMQDYPDVELIVSDDGTPEFEKESDTIIKYIEERNRGNITSIIINALKENKGTVKNINSAIRLSSGFYIKLISSEDCFAHERALSDYVDFMEENKLGICFGKMRGVTIDGTFKDELLACESDYDLLKSYSLKQQRNRLFARNYLPAPAAFMRRKLFDKYGLFDEDIRLIEDFPYWIMLSNRGVKFGFLDEVTVYYRLSGVSSMGSYSEKFMEDMFVIYDKYVFPNDRRYGLLQPVYNRLKKDGLCFYMEKARMKNYPSVKRALIRLRYAPFFAYTWFLDYKVALKNRRIK